MSIPILICDDSGLARKQMARSLPDNWNVSVNFAADGAEGVQAIKEGKADILFLDLNMPVMDGYQVLEQIRAEDLNTLVVVVSGDIQPEARQRVREMGALDFIKKPIDSEKLNQLLEQYGILQELDGRHHSEQAVEDHRTEIAEQELELFEGYQEVANVAMGQAADLLAQLLQVFIDLPIPQVSCFPRSELAAKLQQMVPGSDLSVVSQGFVGDHTSGEAMLFMEGRDLDGMSQLIEQNREDQEVSTSGDLVMNIANILIASCMAGFAEQLDMKFSMGTPALLGQDIDTSRVPLRPGHDDEDLLTIQINYSIRDQGINCTLLLVFTGHSIQPLNERISLLVE
jgi:CheY-like chemotaxis protein/chemotaxis protein CheY-P-specific phosphatase CheC